MSLVRRLVPRAWLLLPAIFLAAAYLLASAPTPSPAAPGDCEPPEFSDGGVLSFTPPSAAPGQPFSVNITKSDLEAATRIVVIWDFDYYAPTPYNVIYGTGLPGENANPMTFAGPSVPAGASPGSHSVGVCYFVDYGDEYTVWWAMTWDFTVLSPADPTPTLSPTATSRIPTFVPPPSSTPRPSSTPVPSPTVILITPVPTATDVPTATPYPTNTVVVPPTATQPPPPTVVVAQNTPPPPPTQSPPTSTPAPTETPQPTATLAATATVVLTPTGTPTPTPTAVVVPLNEPDEPGGDRPAVIESVPLFSEVLDANVALTNLGLAGLSLLIILVSAQIFNQTLSENQRDVEVVLGKILAPFGFVRNAFQHVSEAQAGLRDIGWLGIVVALSVIVNGFLEPGFGLNSKGLVLMGSLFIAVVSVTYLTEGVEALVARKLYGQTAAVRIFPFAVVIAVVCVLLSRVVGFLPGVIYGFIGTAVFLRPPTLSKEESAKSVYIPAVVLLSLSVAAWLITPPLRDWADESTAFLPAFLEGCAIALFVGGIEGLFFNMMPLTFMDGKKIWDWNKLAWLPMALIPAWMFWQVLLHQESSYYSSLKQTTTWVALLLVGTCLVLTIVTWGLFRIRAMRRVS